MRPIMKTTMCALVAAAVTAPAHAAINAYLELGPIKSESAGRGDHKDQIEILSWSWGATTAGDWDGTIKGATGAEKFGAVGGIRRDDTITSPGDVASGRAPGTRPHKPISFTKPLNRGSVRVKVKFPWLDCRVGAAFPDAVLQNAAGRYELKDVVITNCSSSGSGGDRPMESLSLNYAKVQVRGWDPKKKEE